MDKNTIKKYLKSYRGVLECIEFAEKEIVRLESLKTQEQAKLNGICDGMPRAPGVSDTTYSRCQRAIELYDSEIASQKRMKAEAEEQLEHVNMILNYCGGYRARLILYEHYCLGNPWGVVSEHIHYSVRQTKRMGYRALDNISERCHFYGTILR